MEEWSQNHYIWAWGQVPPHVGGTNVGSMAIAHPSPNEGGWFVPQNALATYYLQLVSILSAINDYKDDQLAFFCQAHARRGEITVTP